MDPNFRSQFDAIGLAEVRSIIARGADGDLQKMIAAHEWVAEEAKRDRNSALRTEIAAWIAAGTGILALVVALVTA